MDCQVPLVAILVACLRSLQFNILIHDLGDGLECTHTIFAGITQLGGVVDMLEDKITLRRDLDRLEMGWQKLHDVQQSQIKSPASGME